MLQSDGIHVKVHLSSVSFYLATATKGHLQINYEFEIAEKEFLPNKLLLRGSPDVFLLILCYYFKNDEYETNYIPFYPFCRFRISGKGY